MKDSYVFYKDRLDGAYKPVFEQIELYVAAGGIDESAQEERLGELLDSFLSAQEAGKPVESLVGGNVERFCKNFCADLGIKNRILHILDILQVAAWALLLCVGLDVLGMEPGADVWHSRTTALWGVAMLALYGVIAGVTNMAFRRLLFRAKRFSMGAMRIVAIVEAAVFFAGIFLFSSLPKTELLSVPVWTAVLGAGAYLLLYYAIWGRRDKRRRIRLSELAPGGMPEQLDGMMEKKYERARQRAAKKGRGELTLGQFLDQEEKDCDRAEGRKWFYVLVPVAAAFLSWLVLYWTDGFETALDMFLFPFILLLAEGLIMWGLWRAGKKGAAQRRAWVKARREEPGRGEGSGENA